MILHLFPLLWFHEQGQREDQAELALQEHLGLQVQQDSLEQQVQEEEMVTLDHLVIQAKQEELASIH